MKTSLKSRLFSIESFAAAALLVTLPSCVSSEKKGDSAKSSAEVTASADDEATATSIVVQQSGSEQTLLSPKSRTYFVDARKSLRSEEGRLFATLGTGDAQVAEQDARAYLAKKPNNPAALTVLASALVLQRKYLLAEFYAIQLDKYSPENPDVNNIRGLAALYGGRNSMTDYRRAQSYFQKAFHANASQLASGLNLAHLQLEMGNANAAVETFRTLTKRNSDCTQAWLGLGVAQSRMGSFKEAGDALNTILVKQKDHAEALYFLALVQKNGYNDQKLATKTIRRLLSSSSGGPAVRLKAQSFLRVMEGAADQSAIASEQKDDENLLMTNFGPPKAQDE